MKVKVNDKVLVTSGKYKGKSGKVMRVFKKTGRITVEKINIRTKHIRNKTQAAGEIIKFEAPIDSSNVMVICSSCSKAVRVGYNIPTKGKKYRVCKKCGESVEQAVTKAAKKKK